MTVLNTDLANTYNCQKGRPLSAVILQKYNTDKRGDRFSSGLTKIYRCERGRPFSAAIFQTYTAVIRGNRFSSDLANIYYCHTGRLFSSAIFQNYTTKGVTALRNHLAAILMSKGSDLYASCHFKCVGISFYKICHSYVQHEHFSSQWSYVFLDVILFLHLSFKLIL